MDIRFNRPGLQPATGNFSKDHLQTTTPAASTIKMNQIMSTARSASSKAAPPNAASVRTVASTWLPVAQNDKSEIAPKLKELALMHHLDNALKQPTIGARKPPQRPMKSVEEALHMPTPPSRPTISVERALQLKNERDFTQLRGQVDAKLQELAAKYKLTNVQLECLHNRTLFTHKAIAEFTADMDAEAIAHHGLTPVKVFIDADTKEEISRLYSLQKAFKENPQEIKQQISKMNEKNSDPIYAYLGQLNFLAYLSKVKERLRLEVDPAYRNAKLSNEEMVCMYGYTTGDFDKLNRALRMAGDKPIADEGLKAYAEHVTRGMNKLPDYSLEPGESIQRGIKTAPQKAGIANERLAEKAWKEENLTTIYKDMAFGSATTDPVSGFYRLKFATTTGIKNLQAFSAFPGEKEIVIMPQITFKVMNQEPDENGFYVLQAQT